MSTMKAMWCTWTHAHAGEVEHFNVFSVCMHVFLFFCFCEQFSVTVTLEENCVIVSCTCLYFTSCYNYMYAMLYVVEHVQMNLC